MKKTIIIPLILILLGFKCKESEKEINQNTTIKEATLLNENETVDEINYEDRFSMISTFPKIADTTEFIKEMIDFFKIEVDYRENEELKGRINEYKKIRINGTENNFIILEYEYDGGAMVTFPWRYQILMSEDGKAIETFSGLRCEQIEIMPNEKPFLLILKVTSRGNGGHEIYKVVEGKLENIYEGYYDYDLRTYDKHQDLAVYEPEELKIKINDDNGDGLNDLTFEGELIYLMAKSPKGFWYDVDEINGKTIEYSIENPWKKSSIQFVFLYDKKTGHFIAKENYHEKYELD